MFVRRQTPSNVSCGSHQNSIAYFPFTPLQSHNIHIIANRTILIALVVVTLMSSPTLRSIPGRGPSSPFPSRSPRPTPHPRTTLHITRAISRRQSIHSVGIALVGAGIAADAEAEPEAPPSYPYFLPTTRTGVKIEVLADGTGPEAQPGDRVLLDFVLRRSNGYFVYSSAGGEFQPSDVPVGPVSFVLGSGDCIPGLDETLTGMRVGGKRRALLPAAQAYEPDVNRAPQPPDFAGKRQISTHRREPFLIELRLLKIT